MPAPCSLLLEVFSVVSIYDDIETLDWEISTDPAHETPYLIAPRNYASQEIDAIQCTATIGTVEIGVIDVPQTVGDQTSGWMTARIHDILGRRCRLRRWINDDLGWTTIADGPAGRPQLDSSYAGYRWTIRDTRETERKLSAFASGGVCAVVPRGPIYGFGEFLTTDGPQILLSAALDAPFTGVYNLTDVDGRKLGLVNLAGYLIDGGTGGTTDPRLVMDQAALDAVQISEIKSGVWGARNADVLWRKEGETVWNVARPTSPSSFQQPFVGTNDTVIDGNVVQTANYVTLFVSPHIPEGFPETDDAINIEVIIRYRGGASEDFPYYVEGQLGDVLQSLYNGEYTLAAMHGIIGIVYDPGEQDVVSRGFISRIQYDPLALAAMMEAVLLRQTETVPDARAWAEKALYAPSGWIPALDSNMMIAPVTRAAPEAVDDLPIINDATIAPAPNWQKDHTVSAIVYTYPRYYVPSDLTIKRGSDTLAKRDVTVEFEDLQSELQNGPQIEEYDASAFAAVGDDTGVAIEGLTEISSILAQRAKFDVLDRYRAGVQSIEISARRYQIPNVRVGDWIAWSIMYLPSMTTGLRGSDVFAAQIMSIRDDDCTWRSLILEESGLSSAAPGRVISLEKIGDEPSAGSTSLVVLSDVESY